MSTFDDFKVRDRVQHVEEGPGVVVNIVNKTVMDAVLNDQGYPTQTFTQRTIEEVIVQYDRYHGHRGPHGYNREWFAANPDALALIEAAPNTNTVPAAFVPPVADPAPDVIQPQPDDVGSPSTS